MLPVELVADPSSVLTTAAGSAMRSEESELRRGRGSRSAQSAISSFRVAVRRAMSASVPTSCVMEAKSAAAERALSGWK